MIISRYEEEFMRKYNVKKEIKQSLLSLAEEHPLGIQIFCFLFSIPIVVGFLAILTNSILSHDQYLAQIRQEKIVQKDAWGASIMESMPDMDSIKTQETVHYYMDVRQLDDGNKEVRIQNKDSEPSFLHNATRYYIVYKDFFLCTSSRSRLTRNPQTIF